MVVTVMMVAVVAAAAKLLKRPSTLLSQEFDVVIASQTELGTFARRPELVVVRLHTARRRKSAA